MPPNTLEIKCRGCGRVCQAADANTLAQRLAVHLLGNRPCLDAWCEDLDSLVPFASGRLLAILPTLNYAGPRGNVGVFGISPDGTETCFHIARGNRSAVVFIEGVAELAARDRRDRLAGRLAVARPLGDDADEESET